MCTKLYVCYIYQYFRKGEGAEQLRQLGKPRLQVWAEKNIIWTKLYWNYQRNCAEIISNVKVGSFCSFPLLSGDPTGCDKRGGLERDSKVDLENQTNNRIGQLMI